jgi:hypothetical protein
MSFCVIKEVNAANDTELKRIIPHAWPHRGLYKNAHQVYFRCNINEMR